MQSRENYVELQSKYYVLVNQKIKINISEILFFLLYYTFTTSGENVSSGWEQRDRNIEERIYLYFL